MLIITVFQFRYFQLYSDIYNCVSYMGICITETYLHFSHLSFCYIQLLVLAIGAVIFNYYSPDSLSLLTKYCQSVIFIFNNFVISRITILLAEIFYMLIYVPLLVFILGN